MKLYTLDPEYLKHQRRKTVWMERLGSGNFIQRKGLRDHVLIVQTFEEAHGLKFLCPFCFTMNGNRKEGVHSVICWFNGRSLPEDLTPKGRWNPAGDSFYNFSFIPPGETSIYLMGGCGWQGHLLEGNFTW